METYAGSAPSGMDSGRAAGTGRGGWAGGKLDSLSGRGGGQVFRPHSSDASLPQAQSPLLTHRPWSPVPPSRSHQLHPPQPGPAIPFVPFHLEVHPAL